ncbi:hypothetical protein Tco_0749006 [Tanacetum coccineum]|uniref:Uncharacterized protein n=1 Tax=Tanacetum coccineum TaxID=301880 RepID=A0ABQ4Z015_9ASTR
MGAKTGCWLVLVLAGRVGKGLYMLGCDRERLKMIKGVGDRRERAGNYRLSSLEAEFRTVSFWETASTRTSENEEIETTATIDGRVKTNTEASIRRHLKLEDADGISSLPNTEIFEQLSLMGKVENVQNDLKEDKIPTYGAAYIKLILRVKKLEHKVKASKSRRRARVIIADNEEDLEDSYKHGRIINEIDSKILLFIWYMMKELHDSEDAEIHDKGLVLILRYF